MATQTSQNRTSNSRRRGILTMELLLVLPIFLIVLFAICEFSMLMHARSSMAEYTRLGARVACMPGSTREDVEDALYRVVDHRIGNAMQVAIETGADPGDVVEVAIKVPMNAVAPDMLWLIGFSLEGRELYESARMLKE